VQVECCVGQTFCLEGRRFERLVPPTPVVNQGWAVLQQFMSLALSALSLLLLCEKTSPPHLNLSFITLKLLQVNDLSGRSFCPAPFLRTGGASALGR
jgi:hypothetical protein